MSKQPDKGRPAGTRKLPKLTAKQEAEATLLGLVQ